MSYQVKATEKSVRGLEKPTYHRTFKVTCIDTIAVQTTNANLNTKYLPRKSSHFPEHANQTLGNI